MVEKYTGIPPRPKMTAVAIFLAIGGMCTLLFFSSCNPWWVLHRIELRKISLQTRSDLPAIRDACLRLFTAKFPTSAATRPATNLEIQLSDPAVPLIIRDLNPRYVTLNEYGVYLSWGGGFIDPYGYYATSDPDPSHLSLDSGRKLLDGLYYWHQ